MQARKSTHTLGCLRDPENCLLRVVSAWGVLAAWLTGPIRTLLRLAKEGYSTTVTDRPQVC